MPATSLDAELRAEQAHLVTARAALQDMRRRAEQLYDSAAVSSGDGYTAERLGVTLRQRMIDLAADPEAPLFFGRLDLDPDAGLTSEDDGTRHYIGRRHVVDGGGVPLVLDWRAPLSRSFYRASVRDPQAVRDRRRFGFQHGELTSFEDEHLMAGEELGDSSRILTEEIERPRVGPMRDIVATIQPEQDELVRADLDVSICVQGAPGTGKTAVGLHRAAYLLYAYRERLRRSRVLVVGPNRALLAYISAVLPALGEIDVDQVSLDDLVARTPVRGTDTQAAALVKHDLRMATVLHRALWSRVADAAADLTTAVEVPDGVHRWRLDRDTCRRLVEEVRAEEPAYARGRERLLARLVAALARRAEQRTGAAVSEAWSRRVARDRSVKALVEEAWPATTPEALLAGLLGDPAVLARAADGVLTPDEQQALTWASPPRSPRSARWSAADQWLLDEAAGLIERPREYGHLVIDEAQDLSPMQARALARRSAHGSVTVLGDVAQGTSPWASRTWSQTLGWLGKPEAQVVPLTTGFRVPSVVMDLANRLVPDLGVDVPVARSLRHDGSLDIVRVDGALPRDQGNKRDQGIRRGAVDAARDAARLEGSVGLIAPDSLVATLGPELAAAGLTWGSPDDVDGDARITLVPASSAKGLEYDHVVVVEPARILREEPRGVNRLYVVLTRAVSRLTIVHAEPLPAALT